MSCRYGYHAWFRFGGDGLPEDDDLCECRAFRWKHRTNAWEWQHDTTWWDGERCA